MQRLLDGLSGFNLPMYTFPDCELCDCAPTTASPGLPLGVTSAQSQAPFINRSVLADILNSTNYETNIQNGSTDFNPIVQTFYAGYQPQNTNYGWSIRTPANLVFGREELFDPSQTVQDYYTPLNLPFHERINLMNAKGKFFGSGLNRGAISPTQESPLNQVGVTLGNTTYNYYAGGGTNQIKVCFNRTLNNTNLSSDFELVGNQYNQSTLISNLVNNYDNLGFHYDNVVILLTEEPYQKGTLMTFDNPFDYRDLNLSGDVLNQFGTYSTTGTSINNGISQIYVSHTHPLTGKRLRTKYNISGDTTQNQFLRFPTGIEYFQVIDSMKGQAFIDQFWGGTYDARDKMNSFTPYTRLFVQGIQILSGRYFSTTDGFGDGFTWDWTNVDSPYNIYADKGALYVTILMRGVDPHSTAQPMKIGLGRLFGKQNHWSYSVEGNFKMNIPLQPNDGLDFGLAPSDNSQTTAVDFAHRCTRHNFVGTNNEANQIDGNYTKGRLFFKSYHFKPSQQNWEPFNTTSVFNYIKTSEDDYGVNMVAGYPPTVFQSDQQPSYLRQLSSFYTFNATNSGRGLRIGINNFYTRNNYDGIDAQLGIQTATNTSGDEIRFKWSYQPGEPVEGIPFMCLNGGNLDDGLPSFARNIYRFLRLQPIYYSRRYDPAASTFTMTNAERIVMRSDRLPTSDIYQGVGPNSYGGMSNGNFKIYEVPIEGIVTSGETQPAQLSFQVNEPEQPEVGETPNVISDILSSFSCQSLVPLNCYQPTSNGESVQIAPISNCTYVSVTDRDGDTFNTQFFVQGSCYELVRRPYNQKDNVKNDRELINEWASRININFGACREVFSHLFVNNWINGTLFAIPFKTTRFFTGPNDNPPNQPYNKFCNDITFLHPETFNFYYRSAPFKESSGGGFFVGREGNKVLNQFVGNTKNHMYPTTIMDLGPRDELQKYLSQSGNWDGYIMNLLSPTTFGDTSELLNIFVLSRLANTSFTSLFKSRGSSVLKFFDTRKKRFVDGDFAQLIATNSQFGVDAYDPENYPEPPPNSNLSSSLYLRTNFGSPKDVVFGIFYNGNEQARDYISPNRTIYNEDAQIGDVCASQDIPITTQEVPFYLWSINDNTSRSNIFGNQGNDWKWDSFSYRYQKIDRLLPYNISRMYKPNTTNIIKYQKGWIYNVENVYNQYTEQLDYDPEPYIGGGPFLFGAPFYFYFGLTNGASAFDRFAAKWIDTEGLE
jgi:hypothetical protein